MTQLEERLRRGLRNYSDGIRPGTLAPLAEPPQPLRPRRNRPVRWLAPAAAALAVVGVIAGVSLARQPAQQPAFLSNPVYVPAGPGMPRYYVTVFQTYAGGHGGVVTKAVVHDSATGAALASSSVPTPLVQGGYMGINVAAGDDLTYVIYTVGGIEAGSGQAYLLRVTPDGRKAKLSRIRLSLPGSLSVDYLALSPDDRMLAMQEQQCHRGGCSSTGIRVVTLATGAVRTWTTTKHGAPFNVSWAGNTRVAFLWEGQGRQGYRLLNVTGHGGNLMASKRIASPPPVAEDGGAIPTALVTANGRTVITSSVSPGSGTVTAKIIELNAQTGKQVRVLDSVTGPAKSLEYCQVVSLAPSGLHLLVACPYFGRLDGSKFKPLPGFPSPSHSGISQQSTGAW